MGNSMVSDNDETGGCCNVVLWDILIAAVTSGFAFSKLSHMHWALCIIVGIIVGLVIGVLMLIKYLGAIIQFVFSIIWGVELVELLDSIFGIYKYLDKDSIQMWAIRIGLILFIFVVHLVFNELMYGNYFGFIGEDFLKKIFNKKRNKQYDNLDMEFFRISTYKKKLNDIEDRLFKLAEKKAVSYEEWEQTYKVFEETVSCYNNTINERIRYSTRPKKRCKDIALIISDIQSKSLLMEKNIKYMEQSLFLFEKRMEEEQREHRQKKENNNYKKEPHNDSHQSKYGENQNSNSNKQQNTEDTALIALFVGCNDMESLRKRYRELMKIYHPDNFNGDNEMCQKIQSIYEKLCREYKYTDKKGRN